MNKIKDLIGDFLILAFIIVFMFFLINFIFVIPTLIDYSKSFISRDETLAVIVDKQFRDEISLVAPSKRNYYYLYELYYKVDGNYYEATIRTGTARIYDFGEPGDTVPLYYKITDHRDVMFRVRIGLHMINIALLLISTLVLYVIVRKIIIIRNQQKKALKKKAK
jgi:hypothetical protein